MVLPPLPLIAAGGGGSNYVLTYLLKTRRQLTNSGNFHPNSDIDLLYTQRNLGGRGLQQIQRVFESRIISIRQYLPRNRNTNTNIAYICAEGKDFY